MATVNYWFGSWSSAGGGSDLLPGQVHSWTGWGFSYGEVVQVTAHPVVGPPVDRILAVQDVRIEGDNSGRRVFFNVRNVGPSAVPGYGIGLCRIGS